MNVVYGIYCQCASICGLLRSHASMANRSVFVLKYTLLFAVTKSMVCLCVGGGGVCVKINTFKFRYHKLTNFWCI